MIVHLFNSPAKAGVNLETMEEIKNSNCLESKVGGIRLFDAPKTIPDRGDVVLNLECKSNNKSLLKVGDYIKDRCIKDKIDTYQEIYDITEESGMDIWRLRQIILEKIMEVGDNKSEVE